MVKCQAKTKNGTNCTFDACKNSNFCKIHNKTHKPEYGSMIFTGIIITIFITSPYFIKNHNTFLTGFGYSFFLAFILLSSLFLFFLFKNIVYYRFNNLEKNIEINRIPVLTIFFTYSFLIQTLSWASLYFFEVLITEKIKLFNPELLIYVIPPLFGILLFISRIIPHYEKDLIKKSRSLEKEQDFLLLKTITENTWSSLEKVSNFIFDFCVGILFLSLFAMFVFNTSFQDIIPTYFAKLGMGILIYGFIFTLLDILLIFKKSKKLNYIIKENNTKQEEPLSKKAKWGVAMFWIVLIGTTIFAGYSFYQKIKTPMVNENIKYPAYIVTLEKGDKIFNQDFPNSENVNYGFLNNKTYSLKIIKIDKEKYPLTPKIITLSNNDLIITQESNEFLNVNFKEEELNLTINYRNGTDIDFSKLQYYYRFSEYEQYIFFILSEFNYSKVYILPEAKKTFSISPNYFSKSYFAQNGNNSIYIYMRQSMFGHFKDKDVYIVTRDFNFSNTLKEKITNLEYSINVFTRNETYSYENAFNLTYQ